MSVSVTREDVFKTATTILEATPAHAMLDILRMAFMNAMVKSVSRALKVILSFYFVDIIECDSNNGGCDQNCHNNPGSYTCSCSTGYSKNGFHGCKGKSRAVKVILSFYFVDIIECDSNNGGCVQNCQNNPGSYTCSCNAGYSKNGFHGCNGKNFVYVL